MNQIPGAVSLLCPNCAVEFGVVPKIAALEIIPDLPGQEMMRITWQQTEFVHRCGS